MFPAAGEGHLELAPEVLGVGVSQQEPRGGPRVGRDVERLIGAHAGQGARGDIADAVATGLACRDAHGRQPPHEGGRVVDVHVVQLDVLPGRDVADAVAVLLGDIGERVHLRRIQPAEGDLDPLHARRVPQRVGPLRQVVRRICERPLGQAVVPLAVVVALAVDTSPQPRFGKHLVVQPPLLLQGDLALVQLDFGRHIRWNDVGECFFRRHNVPTPHKKMARRDVALGPLVITLVSSVLVVKRQPEAHDRLKGPSTGLVQEQLRPGPITFTCSVPL